VQLGRWVNIKTPCLLTVLSVYPNTKTTAKAVQPSADALLPSSMPVNPEAGHYCVPIRFCACPRGIPGNERNDAACHADSLIHPPTDCALLPSQIPYLHLSPKAIAPSYCRDEALRPPCAALVCLLNAIRPFWGTLRRLATARPAEVYACRDSSTLSRFRY